MINLSDDCNNYIPINLTVIKRTLGLSEKIIDKCQLIFRPDILYLTDLSLNSFNTLRSSSLITINNNEHVVSKLQTKKIRQLIQL